MGDRPAQPKAGRTGGIRAMSIDKSLKKGGGMGRARNVLTRPERMALLQEDEKWTPAKGVYNLPKTKFRRLAPGQSGPKRAEGPPEVAWRERPVRPARPGPSSIARPRRVRDACERAGRVGDADQRGRAVTGQGCAAARA